MIATITPIDALRGCVEALKQIDHADCKDELVWKAIVAAQGTAEGVLRDYVEPEPVAFMAFSANGNVRIWAAKDNLGAKRAAEEDGLVLQPVYAVPVAAQPAVVAAIDDLHEGRTLLDDLIASITKHGNYSQEATITFLNQIRQCFAAAPAIAAPAEVERDAATLPEKMTPEMREAMWEAITRHGAANLEYWIEDLYNDIRIAAIATGETK